MTVRLFRDRREIFIPHQVLAEDGTYLAGFRTQGRALGYIARQGWKVTA